MKILLVNHYAGSLQHGMEYRPYYLAREWLKLGHTVQIVAASQSHVRTVQPAVNAAVIQTDIDGIRYRWLRTPAYRGNGVGRVLNIASFCTRLAWHAQKIAKEFQPDVVIASSTYPMDIWPAWLIARAARAKLVHEVHDLWPLSPIELGGMSPKHPFIRLCQAAEDFACKHADVVVSMLPKVHDHLRTHGLDLNKLHIVPNGVSVDEWTATPKALDAEIAAQLALFKRDGRVVVGYAGSHGLPNALDVLFNAAALLRDAPIIFVLVGDGHEKERLARRTRDEGLANVRLFPPISKAQIPLLLANFDIAYLGWQCVPIYRFGIAPNKLMDYMMAGCPVLHSVDAGNDPVGESGCGITVPPGSAEAISQALMHLSSLTSAQRVEMGRRGREHILRHHTWPVLARRFVEALA